MIYIEVAFKL